MRVHTATTPLPATTALGRNPTPSTSTTTLCQMKNMGAKTREMVDRFVPSNTWVKLVFRRLAQQIETGIRQTGAPWPTLLVTSPSKPQNLAPPIKPCNVLQQWCHHSAFFPLQHPIGACSDYTRTSFLST